MSSGLWRMQKEYHYNCYLFSKKKRPKFYKC